jgi:hypothetical protein
MLHQQRLIQPSTCLVSESAQFLNFFLNPARPARPEASKSIEAGSGKKVKNLTPLFYIGTYKK